MKKMRWPFCLFLLILLDVLFVGSAYPEEQEYKEHTVSRGENLWSISSKEIVDPFLWPKVWKENPGIKNPDLIYPGQKIRIPLYLLQREVPPKPVDERAAAPEIRPEAKAKEEPVVSRIVPEEKKYLIDRNSLIASGYIADSLASVGQIIGMSNEKTHYGRGDYVYVRTAQPANKGDRFYVIRSYGKVKHPESGAMMGYLVGVIGIIEVVGPEGGRTKVKITSSFGEVTDRDLLDAYYDIEPPFLVDSPRTLTIDGFIVATRERHAVNAQYDIVYIDRGRLNGVEVGDMIATISRNKFDLPNGLIQVISTREKTATAIVLKTEREVVAGDRLGTL